MRIELRIPPIGESITEVQISEWRKSPGEAVRQDEPIVTLETEKVSLDLPAPRSGVVGTILKKKGDTVAVGEVIAYLEEAETQLPSSTSGPSTSPTASSQSVLQVDLAPPSSPTAHEPVAGQIGVAAPRPAGVGAQGFNDDLFPTPQPGSSGAESVHMVETAAKAMGGPRLMDPRQEEAVPMSLLRRRVAERLVQAQQTAALLTTFNEIDMTALTALRQVHQEAFQQRYHIKLGLMSFFVRAVIEALKLVPELNAEIRGTDMIHRYYYDIGIAVGSGRGLVVPVLRNAEHLSFAEIEAAIADFAQRGQSNRLTLEELQGGTFTISNGGVYGSLLSTPIINPPQSGILGLHVIQDRPVAREGQIVIRPMMYVALTYDHRIVDGREAVTFLKHIKGCIEEPARILLEI